MANKEIYLIRHGETDYNLQKIVQGRGVDSSLNETGQNQANSFFQYYKEQEFEHLYYSALQRTKQTIQQFIECGIPSISTEALDEINWGIYEGIEHNRKMHERYLSIVQRWRDGELHIKIDGGESAMDLLNRQLPFIETIKKAPYKKILVCSHGRSIRSLLCAMTNTPLEQMDDFTHTNTCLYKVILIDNKFEVELFNNTDHLNHEV